MMKLVAVMMVLGGVAWGGVDSVKVRATADTTVELQEVVMPDSSTLVDSAGANVAELTTDTTGLPDAAAVSVPEQKSVLLDTAATGVQKIKLIKREYNYRQQMALAIGMMSFIAIMMASSQNWNPK